MRTLAVVALLLLAGLAAPQRARAQGLGDVAARERAKRKQETKPEPAKVFTETDLEKAEAGKHEEAEAADAAEAKGAGPGEIAGADAKPAGKEGVALDPLERERQERKLLEAEWRTRFANAREQVALAEADCWQDVVRTEFYQGIPVQMKVKEFVETEQYRQAKQALADLEEQFRRTGLPPGWAREK
jgi:hypothetical protein